MGNNGLDEGAACRAHYLAGRIFEKIRDKDFPDGMNLSCGGIAKILQAESADIVQALKILELQKVIEKTGEKWTVLADRQRSGRDLLRRAYPLLKAMAQSAAKRISRQSAHASIEAFERFCDRSLPIFSRVDAYENMLQLMAEASGNGYFKAALERLLREARPMIEQLVEQSDKLPFTKDPDDELARLIRAMLERDPRLAAEAIDDHMLIVGQHIDRLG